jgi:hypothetical protein
MLYDPKWNEVITPPEIKIEPWQEILLKAAEVIRKRGWTDEAFQDEAGSVCAIGAFRVVQHGNAQKARSKNRNYASKDMAKALRKFESTLGLKKYDSDARWDNGTVTNIINWNDKRCQGTAEITRLLKKAAKAC